MPTMTGETSHYLKHDLCMVHDSGSPRSTRRKWYTWKRKWRCTLMSHNPSPMTTAMSQKSWRYIRQKAMARWAFSAWSPWGPADTTSVWLISTSFLHHSANPYSSDEARVENIIENINHEKKRQIVESTSLPESGERLILSTWDGRESPKWKPLKKHNGLCSSPSLLSSWRTYVRK